MDTSHPGQIARQLRQRLRHTAAGLPAAARVARRLQRIGERTGDEAGFLLIEVIVSTLLVALIVVATLNGFDAASKGAAGQRWESEAELLAAQSQEQLRTLPATALDALESNPHVFTKEINGTKFTVTQEAKPVNAKATATGCKGTEASKESGANIEITSSVTWPILVAEKRPALKQESIITPPVGSSLEVDVTNGASTPVAGVTAVATFLPTGGTSDLKSEGTTGAAGCVVMTGLDTTLATVEIEEKPNFITTAGTLQYPTQKISIAPNITTPDKVSYAEGGRITAEFRYKNQTEWEGQTVKGDTFVVKNNSIPSGITKWEEGSTAFEYQGSGEEQYKALTGSYQTTAATATATKYAFGDLFPFNAPWTVFAGDCPANEVSSEADGSGELTVTPGGNAKVLVPLSRTALSIWKGSSSSNKGEAETERLGPVKITNTGCKGYETPNNASGLTWVHEQPLTSTAGHLEDPFQPFGAATLCLVDKLLKPSPKTFTVSYTNSTASGTAPQIYLGQRTEAEDATAKSEEATQKASRQSELKAAETSKATAESELTKITTAQKAREKEESEAPAKKKAAETEETKAWETRKKNEEKEIEKWKEQEKTGKPTKLTAAERKAKETEYKKNRETEDTNEKTTRETNEKTAKTNRENAEKARPGEETKWKEQKATAEATITRVNKEETTATGTREAREKEEAAEKASGVSVEVGEKC